MAFARAPVSSGGEHCDETKIRSWKKGTSWQSGETVMVRANQYNWLKGQVKRLARGGVAVWVAEAKLVVHVPLQLAASHLSTQTSCPNSLTSPSLLRLRTCQPDCYLLLAVRPSHLSHRPLFQRLKPAPPAASPCLAVPQHDHQAHPSFLENRSTHAASRCFRGRSQTESFLVPQHHTTRTGCSDDNLCYEFEQERHGLKGAIAQELANLQSTPGHAKVLQELEPVSAPGSRPSSQTGHISIVPVPGGHPSCHATPGIHAEAAPKKAHFPDSPPLSPTCSTSQRELKLLESIPESFDCTLFRGGDLPTLEEVVKTTSGRFSGPHLEVPQSDNGASSSSSTATTPSPGRRLTLAERIKKLKLPASEKTSPSSQPEKQRSISQPQSLHGSWITIIQDGTHGKTQRFPTN